MPFCSKMLKHLELTVFYGCKLRRPKYLWTTTSACHAITTCSRSRIADVESSVWIGSRRHLLLGSSVHPKTRRLTGDYTESGRAPSNTDNAIVDHQHNMYISVIPFHARQVPIVNHRRFQGELQNSLATFGSSIYIF